MAASKCYLTTTTGSDSWPEETRGVVFVSEGRLRGNSALCLNHCHAVILCNRGQRCMLYLCLNNMQFFLPIWWFMFVRLRACEGNTHTHTRHYSDIAHQLFFPPHSPLCRLYPWIKGLFGFSSGFPLFSVTLVLLSVSWPGYTADFFFLSFFFLP